MYHNVAQRERVPLTNLRLLTKIAGAQPLPVWRVNAPADISSGTWLEPDAAPDDGCGMPIEPRARPSQSLRVFSPVVLDQSYQGQPRRSRQLVVEAVDLPVETVQPV